MNKFDKIKLFGCMLYLLTISAVLHAQGSGWSVSPYDYRYDMTVYAQLTVDEEPITDFANYEVGAFVGNECRGVAKVNSSGGSCWLYVRVYSNVSSGETVEFKVFNKERNKVFGTSGSVAFSSSSAVGTPSSPLSLVCYMTAFSISAQTADELMGSVSLQGGGDEVIYGSRVVANAYPAEGHSFVNWTDGSTVVSTDNPYVFKAISNVDMIANFKVNQYDVVFVVDGVETRTSQDFGSVITAPASPEKEGHTFTGWNPAFVDGATVPVGGITYTATWRVNRYTITFDSNGGSAIAPITQDYGTAVTAPADPVREGYTFQGWDQDIPSVMPARDMTLKAEWKINQYMVSFVVDGVTVQEDNLDYGSVITAPASPEKEGHTFTGWNPAFVDGATVPVGGITYTATWRVNRYTITFDSNGGSAIAPITQDYGTAVTAPADPVREGYTFQGWDQDIPSVMPARDMTLKAEWKINQYMVSFVVDGVTVQEDNLDYGSVITAPASPEKEGHTFTGWSPELLERVPATDITFTACFSVNVYKLTYYVNDEIVLALDKGFGEAIEPFTPEVGAGMKFDGWQDEIPTTMPAHDLDIHGKASVVSAIMAVFADGNTKVDVYSLRGLLVIKAASASDVSHLPNGIYVVRGKKYVKN